MNKSKDQPLNVPTKEKEKKNTNVLVVAIIPKSPTQLFNRFPSKCPKQINAPQPQPKPRTQSHPIKFPPTHYLVSIIVKCNVRIITHAA